MHADQAVPSSSQEHVKVKQEEGYEASSSSQKMDKKPVVKDPYHGHEETAKMSARFVSVDVGNVKAKRRAYSSFCLDDRSSPSSTAP